MIGKLKQLLRDTLGEQEGTEGGHDLRLATAALLARADARLEHAVSLYEFTRVLNDTLSAAERRAVVQMVAEVAATDGQFDKHEQHLLSKLADLLHLRRAEYANIRASVLQSRADARE